MSDRDEDAYLAYLYGELEDAEASALLSDAARDPELAERLDEDAELLGLLREVPWEEAPPPDLSRLAQMAAEARPVPWTARLKRWWARPHAGWTLVGATAVLIVVGGAPTLLVSYEPTPFDVSAHSSAPAPVAQEAASSDFDKGFEPEREMEAEIPGASNLAMAPEESAPAEARSAAPRKAERARAPEARRQRRRPKAASGGSDAFALVPAPAPVEPSSEAFDYESAEEEVALADEAKPARGGAGAAESDGRALDEVASAGAGGTELDPNAGNQPEAGRLLVQAAVQARAAGRLDEARSALTRAAARVFRLPMLGEVLLLRAEIELEDRRYAEAETYAERALRVEGFADAQRAASVLKRAHAALEQVTH